MRIGRSDEEVEIYRGADYVRAAQADAGTPVTDVYRQLEVSEAAFYVWKKKYGNLGVSELRELRHLRDENTRLKHLVADLTLDRHVLQEVFKKEKDREFLLTRRLRRGPRNEAASPVSQTRQPLRVRRCDSNMRMRKFIDRVAVACACASRTRQSKSRMR